MRSRKVVLYLALKGRHYNLFLTQNEFEEYKESMDHQIKRFL